MNGNCEALLLEYAAGTLDDAHTLIVSAYLTLSPEGRRYVADCERLGGALVAHLCDPVDVSPACLERLLEKIDCAPPACTEKKICSNATCIPCEDLLPAPLAGLLPPEMGDKLVWKRSFSGLRRLDLLPAECASQAQLMHCSPGFRFPRHHHNGMEITLVLEGSFSDGQGHYRRGDLLIAEDGTTHAPVADAKTGCLCFCVTTHPIRFSGFFARLRNRN